MSKETYLGDAVYASFDGWMVKVRTGDGNNQVIYLEPAVCAALIEFVENLNHERPPQSADDEEAQA